MILPMLAAGSPVVEAVGFWVIGVVTVMSLIYLASWIESRYTTRKQKRKEAAEREDERILRVLANAKIHLGHAERFIKDIEASMRDEK